MTIKFTLKTLVAFLFCFSAYASCGDKSDAEDKAMSEDKTMTEDKAISENQVTSANKMSTGDAEAGEIRYKKTCINCHGKAGKGVASYPKISGKELSDTKEKLETYRAGKKIGPNSSLMIMMAKPLTDEEITNLAIYLKDATYK